MLEVFQQHSTMNDGQPPTKQIWISLTWCVCEAAMCRIYDGIVHVGTLLLGWPRFCFMITVWDCMSLQVNQCSTRAKSMCCYCFFLLRPMIFLIIPSINICWGLTSHYSDQLCLWLCTANSVKCCCLSQGYWKDQCLNISQSLSNRRS